MQNNPRSFQKFKKIPLLLAVVFLGISSFSFYYLFTQINNNKKLAETMQNNWQTETSRRNEIESLDKLLKSTETGRVLLESHFAKSSDIVPFLDTIEKLATKVGARSEVVSVDILKDKSGLMMEVRSVGSFEAVYKFLTLLENAPYELEFTFMDMQNTNIQYDEEDKVVSSEWSANFKIKLLSFIQ